MASVVFSVKCAKWQYFTENIEIPTKMCYYSRNGNYGRCNVQARLTEIHINEILSYLGMNEKNAPSDCVRAATDAEKMLFEAAEPRLTYKIFDSISACSAFISGDDIKEFLNGSRKIVVFAATLGAYVDAKLLKLSTLDIAASLYFDACANAAIENVCDNFCADMSAKYKNITERYSPGYGDYPISAQNTIARVLDMQKNIGVSVSQSGLLIPQKSVTAVFGIKK